MSAEREATWVPISRTWLIGIGVVSALALASAALRPRVAGSFAYGAGYYLIPAIIVTLIYWAVSRTARNIRWRVFGVIYCSFLVGHGIGVATRDRNAERARENIKAAFTEFTSKDSTKNVSVPATSNVSGDAGVMEILAKSLFNEMAQVQQEYVIALDKLGWSGILDASRLAKDLGMRESRKMVTEAESLVEKYRAKSVAVLDSMPEKVQQASFQSEVTRRDFLKGMANGRATGMDRLSKTWGYEKDILNEYKGLIDLLTRRERHFAIDKEQAVLFEDQTDADSYNAHLAKIAELLKAQTDAVEKGRVETMKQLDSH